MRSVIVLFYIFSFATAVLQRPSDYFGGLNPDFGDFIPATPIVRVNESSEAYIENYPRICSDLFLIPRLWSL